MTLIILDPLSNASVARKGALAQAPDARYNFLAHSILNSLGENGGISLVVADSSVESGSLRETLEQIHGELRVYEVPCREAIASARIIPSLPHFVSSASAAPRSLPGPGALARAAESRHAPMLFICDGADGLEDEQLETMYSLSRGKHGPLGVVLLAKPEFLLRMQDTRLNHIRGALSACFWSQRSSYGAVVAADRDDEGDGIMPLNPAQLPSPLLERLTKQQERADPQARILSALQNARARAETSRLARIWRYRRLALTAVFSIGYLLIAGGAAYVLSRVSSDGQTSVAATVAPAPLRLTTSQPARSPEGPDSTLARTALAPSPVAAPSPAPSVAAPAARPEKSAPSTPPVEAVQKYQAPTEPPKPAIAASAAAQPKPDAPAPETKLSEADRALFAQRGNELLAAGDIASARLFFERAANAGDAGSALGMAKTFDPRELAKAGVRGVKGDQAKADYWYQRAHSLAETGTSGPK